MGTKRTRNTRKTGREMPAFFTDDRRSRYLAGIERVDYKDTELLKKFMTERGRIIPARIVGTTSKQQRQLKKAIKRARVMGLVR
jgi:small subunit ribosomal protein S18